MEQFDINKFKQNKTGIDWKFTRTDGIEVWQFESTNGYIEHLQKSSSPYVHINAYDFKGNLVAKSTEFYSVPVGKLVYFDPETGKVIKEDDYEAHFQFSIDDLAKKMKQEYHFDIMNKNDTFLVSRIVDQDKKFQSFYEVYQKKDGVSYNVYLVDGKMGKVVYKMILGSEGDSRLIYDEYLKNTKH